MTENYWRVCGNPTALLAFLRGRAGDRRLRLFACACARRVWNSLDAPGRWAVQAAERAADGEGPDGELWAAHVETHGAALRAVAGWGMNRRHDHAKFAAASAAAPDAAEAAVMVSQDMLRLADEGLRRAVEEAAQVAAIRCVVGDPFRPVAVEPDWLTSTVLALARRADEAREFDVLPILADALQDAGCDDERILTHCRQTERPHHTGCWLLSKLERAYWNFINNTESRELLLRLAGRLRQRVTKHLIVYLAARLRSDPAFTNLVVSSSEMQQGVSKFWSVCERLKKASESGDPVGEYLSIMWDWHLLGFNECRLIREYVPDA